jgi:hypothetical protein
MDRLRQSLGVPEGIGDPLGGQGIAAIAGVTHERPPGPPWSADEVGQIATSAPLTDATASAHTIVQLRSEGTSAQAYFTGEPRG